MPNRLASESSPYLRQHADNPVDWWPWGADALAEARSTDRPILLSIGYAACHWCHVMAHESFEDETTAALMNAHFVNIKVDREERPDLDGIYMQAVQAMTGQGGWPMTVFLEPDGAPFFGGTYFPPQDRHGLPSFRRVLASVAEAWKTRREEVLQSAERLRAIYGPEARGEGRETEGARREAGGRADGGMRPEAGGRVDGGMRPEAGGRADGGARPEAGGRVDGGMRPEALREAYEGIASMREPRFEGLGGAPKFPHAMALDFCLRHWARSGDAGALDIAHKTFLAMARGGIYDQVGGGFARYSTDARWLVPHFEKMLYDNALLARLGVHLWQATGDAEVRRVTEETLRWAMREMTSPGGGWYASLDADSEGEEGTFYIWSAAQLRELLGADYGTCARAWGVSDGGNFEGRNILHVADAEFAREHAETLERAKRTLYDARAKRVWPGRDEKVVTSWNGLMLRAMCEGARVFRNPGYFEAAVRCGAFLSRALVRDGRVMRAWMEGTAKVGGFLEDYASLGLGYVALYQATFDRPWLDRAQEMAAACVEWFWEETEGVFYDTPRDGERLITRPRDVADNATPAGSSLAMELQLFMAEYFGDGDARGRADRVLASVAGVIPRMPVMLGHVLGAADMAVHGAIEVAIAGPGTHALEMAVHERYLPSLVLSHGNGKELSGMPIYEGRSTDRATAYVCRGYACEVPATEVSVLEGQLRGAARERGGGRGNYRIGSG